VGRGKAALAAEAAQLAGARARHGDPGGLGRGTVEGAGELQDEAARPLADAAGEALQADEVGGAVGSVLASPS